MNNASPSISVILPCLNEEKTIPICIQKAKEGILATGLSGEIILADNGSNDSSIELAKKLGAKVINVKKRGCGAALQAGFTAASGTYIVMADTDDSYDLRDIPLFINKIKEGYDLVNGNRFKGSIVPGAMPFLHQYFGNHFLSYIARILFFIPCGDLQCGMRAFKKSSLEHVKFNYTGMEFTSEMIIQAKLAGLRIGEIPITLHKDGRGRRPHLKTFHHGFKYLFMILNTRIGTWVAN